MQMHCFIQCKNSFDKKNLVLSTEKFPFRTLSSTITHQFPGSSIGEEFSLKYLSIGHIQDIRQYVNTWLGGFQDNWELRDKRKLKKGKYNFDPNAPEGSMNIQYVKHGLFCATASILRTAPA